MGTETEAGGRAGNPENGTKDAVWMPILEAYTLIEQCPEIVQLASFLTGILAGHLYGDKTLAKKRATIAVDSLRRRHPLLHPPEWDRGLQQEKLTGKGIKAWVVNLGIDACMHMYACTEIERETGTGQKERKERQKITERHQAR